MSIKQSQNIENKVIRKTSLRLIPFLVLAYLFNYVDRVNLGFAALQMNEAIGLTASTFGYGAGILFIGYWFFGVPSNIGLHRYGAKVWIASLMILWGLVSAGMSLVSNVTEFLTMRFLLGAVEAGYFPGVVYYLTRWFPQKHHARVVSRFMFAQPLALTIGSAVSGYLLTLDGTWGIAGWKWLFILEGIPASIMGIVSYFYLSDAPEKSSFLKENEKKWLISEIEQEQKETSIKKQYSLWQVMTHPFVWVLALIYTSQVLGVYGVNMWLPQMVKSLGAKTVSNIGLISSAPFIAASIGMLCIGFSSDRHKKRKWHMIGSMMIAGLGLILCPHFNNSLFSSILLISISAIGFYGCMPIFWTLPSEFLTGSAAAAGIAFINSIGNLGGFIAPAVIGKIKDYSGSFSGGLYFMGFSVLFGCFLTLLLYHLKTKNQRNLNLTQ